MSCRKCLFILAMVAGLGVLGSNLDVVAGGGKDPKKKDPPKKKDNEASIYFKHLQARFHAWDANKDNFLDRTELAKAFRGPNAQSYDKFAKVEVPVPPPPPPPPPAEKKVRRISLVLLCLPRPSLFGNVAVAELLTEPVKAVKVLPPPPPPPPVNLAIFPDYVFTVMLTKNREGKISKQEFEHWGRDYARAVDNFEDAQQAVKSATQKVQNAKTADAKKKAQTELQQHQRELSVASTQLGLIPPAIHAALKIKK